MKSEDKTYYGYQLSEILDWQAFGALDLFKFSLNLKILTKEYRDQAILISLISLIQFYLPVDSVANGQTTALDSAGQTDVQ